MRNSDKRKEGREASKQVQDDEMEQDDDSEKFYEREKQAVEIQQEDIEEEESTKEYGETILKSETAKERQETQLDNLSSENLEDLSTRRLMNFNDEAFPVTQGEVSIEKFAAEEIDMTYSTVRLNEKKRKNGKASQKLAYFPDQEAPAPVRRGEKERNLDSSHNKANKNVLAHAPPNPYVHPSSTLFEEQKQEIEQGNWHQGVLPGAHRVPGIAWNGEAEVDDCTVYENNSALEMHDDKSNTQTNEYLVEAHAVEDTVLVEAKPDTYFRRNQWWIVGGALALLIMIIATAVLLTVDLSGPDVPTSPPTTVEDGIEARVTGLIVTQIPESEAALSNESMPQYKALQWIINKKIESNNDSWYSDNRILRQYSLVSLYLSTSSDDDMNERSATWKNNDKWMQTNDECEWYGVVCDEKRIIVSLNLFDNNLGGAIPADIGLLSTLTNLDFNLNALSGSLPNELFKLTNLSTLNLAQNLLIGGIPSSVGELSGLSLLDVSENQLSSTLPTNIGKVSALITLNVSNNDMFGSIPSEIGNLSELEELDLHDNSYSLKLPTEMGKLVALTELYLQNNDLLGPLPSEMGLMKNLRNWNMSHNHVFSKIPDSLWKGDSLRSLESLDLSHNLLTGNSLNYDFEFFGSSWGKLTSLNLGNNFFRGNTNEDWSLPEAIIREFPNLEEIDISSNFFSGTVSAKLFDMAALKILNLGKSGIEFDSSVSQEVLPFVASQLSSLKELNLSNCNVAGTFPTEIGFLNQLNSIMLGTNKLVGAIPTEIGLLNQLTSIRLDSNEFNGTIPTQIGLLNQLSSIVMDSNSLSGQIPTEFGDLVQLKKLIINENELTGSIPTEIGNLVEIEVVDLRFNAFNGAIPNEVGKLVEMQYLSLNSNELTGTLPTEIVGMVQIEELDLRVNKLIGTIPTEIGVLHELKYLYLESNQLIGTIPTDIVRLVQLRDLGLSNNKLNGTISSDIGVLNELEYLYFDSNELTGTIPAEIAGLVQLKHLRLGDNKLNGTIPTEVGSLGQLKELVLDGNNLKGSMPTEIGKIDQMEKLHLLNNQLTGTIPSQISSLATNRLKDLWLQNNLFTGSIPFSFCAYDYEGSIKVDCEDVVCHCCNPMCTEYPPPTSVPSFKPSELPSFSTEPSISPSKSFKPSISQAPTQQTISLTIEIKLDQWPSETGWNITDGDDNTIYRTPFGTYTQAQQYTTVFKQIRLPFGSDYIFYLLDSHGDGQDGRVYIYLGDVADKNSVLGYYDRAISLNWSSVYPIPFLPNEGGIIEYITLPPTNEPTTEPPPTRRPTRQPSPGPTPKPSPFPTTD